MERDPGYCPILDSFDNFRDDRDSHAENTVSVHGSQLRVPR